MLDKVDTINEYLDVYESLLTSKQRNICDYYYREDYSLAEIAELLDISRSAIFDTIKKSELLLTEYEEKIGFIAYQKKVQHCFKTLNSLNNVEVNTIINQCLDTE